MKKLMQKEDGKGFESVSIVIRIVALFALTGLIFVLGDKNITGGSVSEVFGGAANYIVAVLAVIVVAAFTYLAFKR